MQRRLLILKCSNRKRNGTDLLAAIERYDGPLWQVLRAAQREQPLLMRDLDVYVLSAAFGLIPAMQPIPWYDQTMAPDRADEIRPTALAQFERLIQDGYEQICLGLSRRYLRAIEGWESLIPVTAKVTITDGPMGTKLGQLRSWLYRTAWSQQDLRPVRLNAPEQPRGRTEVAGVVITLSRDDVLEVARQGLRRGDQRVKRFRDWYVLVDGQRVAPKWLVSQISNLPTTKFDASAARRVLLALGVSVERLVKH